MILITACSVVSLYPHRPKLAVTIGAIYLFLLAIDVIDLVGGRKAKDYAQAEVLREVFAQINRDLFNDNDKTRFTLFRLSPFHRDYIVPWYRYTQGVRDVIAEASRSKAFYKKGEGFTGRAWADAGDDLFISSFPKFETREKFEEYYTKDLGIEADIVRQISDYMMNVRTILSYGLIGMKGQFLGVISIDVQQPIDISSDDPFPRIGGKYIHSDTLAQSLRYITDALESSEMFAKR